MIRAVDCTTGKWAVDVRDAGSVGPRIPGGDKVEEEAPEDEKEARENGEEIDGNVSFWGTTTVQARMLMVWFSQLSSKTSCSTRLPTPSFAI